jgi:hypothetical protein
MSAHRVEHGLGSPTAAMGQTRSFGGVGSMSGLPEKRTRLKDAQHLALCRSSRPRQRTRPGLLEHCSVPGRMIPGATALAASSLETIHFGPEYCGRALLLRRAVNGGMELDAQATKLQTAENDLKQLMADVTRAMEKAQDAVTRIAPKAAAATTETESTSR